MNAARGRIAMGGLFAALVLMLVSIRLSSPTSAADDGQGACRYVAAYGAVYEMPSGELVNVTPATVGPIMRSVLTCAEQNLSPADIARYRQQSDSLPLAPMASDGPEPPFVRIELASAISGDMTVDEQRHVARRLIAEIGLGDVNEIVRQQGALDVLLANQWQKVDPSNNHRSAMATYIANCEAAQVPVPKAMDADPHWSKQVVDLSGEVDKYFIATEKTDVRIWTYNADNGGKCVTLLRHDPAKKEAGPTDPLIGTICVNPDRSRACFFENEVYADNGSPVRLDESEMRATDFDRLIHPLDFFDRCNQCHLGDNPFIVHPNMMLGNVVRDPPPKQPFQFVAFGGAAIDNWHNPNPIDVSGDGGACMKCHNIAKTSLRPYCSIVMKAANSTMPPKYKHGPSDNFWPDDNGCFSESVKELKDYFMSVRRLASVCGGVDVVKNCNGK